MGVGEIVVAVVHGSWSWRRDLSHSVRNTICRRSTHFSSEQLNLGLNLNYWPCLTPFTADWALSAVIKIIHTP